MHLAIENHGDMSCEIEVNEAKDHYMGTLKYRTFDVGLIVGPNLDAVHTQFQAICEMVDTGGMVRYGIIMLGYHNKVYSGDVLLVDGEIIGEWTSGDLEWCHFTAIESSEITCSAPSPWMLHESIANWVQRDGGTKEHL